MHGSIDRSIDQNYEQVFQPETIDRHGDGHEKTMDGWMDRSITKFYDNCMDRSGRCQLKPTVEARHSRIDISPHVFRLDYGVTGDKRS